MSFRFKTIAGTAVIQTLLLIMIIATAQILMRQSHERELRQRAVTTARLFVTTTRDAVFSMDLASLKSFVEEAMKNQDLMYARVLDAKNRVLAQAGPANLLERPFKEDHHIHGLDDDVFDIQAEIEEAGVIYGRVEIGLTTRTILGSLTDARWKIIGIALVEITLSTLGSILLGHYLVRRLNLLKEASERISAGEIGYQICDLGNDEIGITAGTFNIMSAHLKDLLAEIKARNISLQAEMALRMEAEAQLQKAHEQLEKRVEERTRELAEANTRLKTEIEERLQAEAKKQELESQLQRSQKMEALGTLAGGVAHDLNNVLSGLVSYPDLLLHKLDNNSPLRKPIETIRKSGVKAAAIVQDLLALARRGVMAMEILNLNEIVDEYLRSPEYTRLMSRHFPIKVKTDLHADLLNIEGSPIHLAKTLMNLMTNAAEAMNGDGLIRIKTENRYIDRPLKGYDAIVEGDYVVLVVSDQGTGISPEDQQRIFEPFYTKKVMGRSGTGLGMAVVWGTVKDHNGYIDLHSIEGQGTSFSLYFPSTRKPPDKQGTPVTPDMYKGQGETVLVVDDIEEQRQIAHALLTTLGYTVETACSGEAAMEYLKNNKVDLVILDMIMEPGLDGLDTYRKILELHPLQKALIASGFSETDRVKEAQRLGAGPYIRKPYTIDKIGMAVRTVLDTRDS